MLGDIACVYISTFGANLGSKLNSLNFDSNILFFLWAQNSYDMKHWILFQNKNRVSQSFPWDGVGTGSEIVFLTEDECVTLLYKISDLFCKQQKIALPFIIVALH